MRTDELAAAMHRTTTVPPVDVDAITRRGRRLLIRRRAAGAAVAVVCAAAVAVPVTLAHTGGRAPAAPAVGRQPTFTPAHPAGAVADTGDKFYFGKADDAVGESSLGPEAIWVEHGDPAYRLTFGFRDEATGRLLRAGAMTVPAGAGSHVTLPAIPRQAEPTYVGMFRLPAGADAEDYSVAVETSPSTPGKASTRVHQSGSVRPGYLVFWVTAAEDLASRGGWWAVENARGDYQVSGGFQPQPQAVP